MADPVDMEREMIQCGRCAERGLESFYRLAADPDGAICTNCANELRRSDGHFTDRIMMIIHRIQRSLSGDEGEVGT